MRWQRFKNFNIVFSITPIFLESLPLGRLFWLSA
jgi:hypothetical protein